MAMGPKLSVKYRRRSGVPYAVEQLAGRQYRCRHCNTVFISEKEFNQHLKVVATFANGKCLEVDSKSPVLNATVDIHVGYYYDIQDFLRRKYLRLGKNEAYDGDKSERVVQKK